MDGPSVSAARAAAAATTVLADIDRTTQLANDFLNDVAAAQDELEPVLVELFELGGLVRQIRTTAAIIPPELQVPLAQTLQHCDKVCKHINHVLEGCGHGPLRADRWAVSDAPVQVQQWKAKLEFARRTVKIAVGAAGERQEQDVAQLRQELAPEMSLMESQLSDCLDAVEGFLAANRRASLDDMTRPPATPNSHASSIPDIIMSFRDPSPDLPELEHSAGKLEPGPLLEKIARPPSSLETIPDEDLLEPRASVDSSSRPSRRSMSPAPPLLSQRRLKLLSGNGLSPIYPLFPPSPTSPRQPGFVNGWSSAKSLSPPSSPPPDKALPPIPVPLLPPRSPRRPSPRIPSSPRAPAVPPKSRARAFSDVTHDSSLSKLSPNVNRWSGPFSSYSTATTRPIRPSHGSTNGDNNNNNQPPVTTDHSSEHHHHPSTLLDPISTSQEPPRFELIPVRRRLDQEDKDTASSHGGVYSIDTSPSSNIIATRQGKFHVKIYDLSATSPTTTIKVPFYVQARPRSREFFVRCQAILSETRNLVAIATGFGQTVEIWNWAHKRPKKLQTLHDAHRWAALPADIASQPQQQQQQQSHGFFPLATYREDENTIKLYPVVLNSSSSSSSKPLGKPRIIDLRKANLPHLPKFPELAYSPTAPLLLAAAGPRPPRPNAPPPAHSALLMAWQLDGDARIHAPYRFMQTDGGGQLANALPLWLATYGSVAVSIWAPARFRTIGGPVVWQVEPVVVTDKIVLVWEFGGGGAAAETVTTYRIPDVLACVSPDCRFVAYCEPGSREGGGAGGALVILDAMKEGRELWRLNGTAKEETTNGTTEHSSGRSSFRRSGVSSSETWRSVAARSIGSSSPVASSKSEGSLEVFKSGGLDTLAASLDKVTDLAFSGDGTQLFVGDVDGNVGVYELREGLGVPLSA